MPEPPQPKTPAEVLRDLVVWSERLPLWQRDAFRRLYQTCALNEEHKAELLAMCKKGQGLLDEEDDVPDPQPLLVEHVPVDQTTSETVRLRSITNVAHVNALVANQSLSFEETGLTIIYGDNGAGKSGYARVLKKVCRSRASEDILQNVYETDKSSRASATLTFSANGQVQTCDWQDGNAPSALLSHVSLFDAGCAPIHVRQNCEPAYIPIPLQILQGLAGVCTWIRDQLRREKEAFVNNAPGWKREPRFNSNTKAGRLLRDIDADSSIEEAQQLAALSIADKIRIDELQAQFKHDPDSLKGKEEAKKLRFTQLLHRIERREALVNDLRLNEYKELILDAETKAAAARIAAKEAFNSEPLSENIGSPTWRLLWAAARNFSLEVYPEIEFPNVDAQAVCVLCQQPLELAADRLTRFDRFVKEDTQRSAEAATIRRETAKKSFQEARTDHEQRIEEVSMLRDELGASDLATKLRRFNRHFFLRSERVLQCSKANTWPLFPSLPDSPVHGIKTLIEQTESRIKELGADANSEEWKRLRAEFYELRDRSLLSELLGEFRLEVTRHKTIAALEAAIETADSWQITRQCSIIADLLITEPWRDRFATEVRRLGFDQLNVELQRGGSSLGTTQFAIVLTRNSAAPVGNILSEGEHRCVAIAAFLADLATADNKSALVFDDPVSSLDHEYREAVAARLIEEAADGRQVVVFTHDVFFLEQLSRHARQKAVSTKFRTITQRPDKTGCGCVEDGIPSNVAPTTELAHGIERQTKQWEQAYRAGKSVEWNQQTNSLSIQLRKCWERAVAEILSPVIKRFDSQINTKNVWQIAALEQSDFVEMRRAYKRCSELNHERCAELGRKDPMPSDYYREVQGVTDWLQQVRGKQQIAQQNSPPV